MCRANVQWMTRGRLLLAVAGAGVTATVLLFGGAFSSRAHTDPLAVLRANAAPASPDTVVIAKLLQGLSSGDTNGLLLRLEQRVASQPDDADTLAALGLAYQQRGRETGDPTYYRLSGEALHRASAAGGSLPLIAQGEASLANTRHRFREGLRLANEAIGLDPYNGSAYGALGDALLNLGRYQQAFKVYDKMSLISPGIASFTRVGSARELTGRPDAAVGADTLALETGETVPENVAWTMTQI